MLPGFDCKDCGIDTSTAEGVAEYYMVHNHVWEQAGLGKGMLCIGCLEARIGRTLNRNDFTNCPLNSLDDDRWIRWEKSERLIQRLTT